VPALVAFLICVGGIAILPTSHFFISCFLAALPLLLSTRPNRREIAFALISTGTFLGEVALLHKFDIVHIALALGMGSIVGMFSRKPQISVNSIIAIALPVSVFTIAAITIPLCALTPHTIDSRLHSIDFGIGDAFQHAANSVVPFGVAMYVVYVTLPLAMAFMVIFSPEKDRLRIGGILAFAAVCALPFYLLFPAVGPSHVHYLGSPRNCMPSLHLTWALLLVVLSERRWLKYVMACFAALTAVATLTTGEHYAIDLVAAIPFTWCVLWLSRNLSLFTAQKQKVPLHRRRTVLQ
jgi:hypothetical protein